jgi:hypothetical protein
MQMHDATLGAAADRAREMERGRLRRSAGKHEGAERLELRIGVVDRALELLDARVVDARLFEVLRHLLAVGSGEQRAEGEEVALHEHEQLVDARHRLDGARQPEDGVELVHVTVRLDARIVLRDAPPAEQPRRAGVAGSGVDLHRGKDSPGGMTVNGSR